MKRNIDLNEISDGRLYSSGDMVKADCHDCAGCSACCRGMGDSIKLDPMDIWRLKKGVGKEFTALMEQEIELGIVDGMILPNVRMTPEALALRTEVGPPDWPMTHAPYQSLTAFTLTA